MAISYGASLSDTCPVFLTSMLYQENCPIEGESSFDSAMVDPSVAGNRLIQNADGSLSLDSKSAAFVLGEKIRDAAEAIFGRIQQWVVGSGQDSIPFEKDESIQSDVCVISNGTCPVMSTWLDFTKLMCVNGGGITISPMRDEQMSPKKGIVVALRGFSKILPAQEFCSKSKGSIFVEKYVKDHAE